MRPGHVVSAVMHHFALGIDVVIIAVDFDQAYIRQLIVDIVAKRSILFNDSVLRCTDQFAILIKIVIAGLLQSMSPSDVVRAVPYNFTFGVHIVEITIDLDQSDIGRRSVDVVAEHPVGILHNTVLRRTDHLALCIEAVITGFHDIVRSGAVVILINDQLCAAVDIIDVIPDPDHSGRRLDTVNVVIKLTVHILNSIDRCILMQDHTVLIKIVEPRREPTIGLVQPAVLTVQHSVVDSRRKHKVLLLVQIFLRCKVIIVDLAVLLDNALQTGFFFDDAAVEPIGIISDAVNTGNVALEYAFRIKDAACFFRCSIGDQRHDAGSCVSGFGVQIVGIAVNDCPTGLLHFAVLVVLLAVHIRKPAVPDLPLCIQRHIAGQFKNCALIGIGGSAAICGSVPADELVVLTGKGVGFQSGVHTDLKDLRRHLAHAAIGVEGNSVEHTGSCRVLRRISRILFSNHNLRAPAGEGVAVVLVRSLICASLERRHGALQIIFLSYDLTINYPSDMCAGLRNFLALFQQFIADRAVGIAGIAGCRECRLVRIANLRLVAGSRDHFLRNKNLVTDGAVLAFRQARLGAGRSLCLVNDFGVTLGWNLFLCNEDFIAHRAVLALGLAGFCAGRLNCRVNDLGMSLGRNFFLCNEYSIADGAVLAFGQTSLRAGRSLCCIDYFCVAGRGDLFHTGENRITNGALRTGRMTSLGAGSGLFRNFNRSMSSRVDCFGLGCIANCAGVGLDAGILTGGSGRNLTFIPLVAGRRDLGLRSEHRAADRAADAIRQTRFGAGCRLAHNGLLGVAGRRNLSLRNKNFVADGAVLALGLAGRGAGRLHRRVDDLGMALSLNSFALGDFFAADGADCITGVAGLGAGGVFLVDDLSEVTTLVLPLGVKSGVLGQINSRTIRIGVTSAVGCGVPAREIVAFTGERVCVQCGIRLCIYGLWVHRAFDRVFRTSVGFKGNRQLHRRFAAPNAIDIVNDIASVCGRSFGVRTVGVVQLGSGDGDSHCTAVRIILIGCGRRAGVTLLFVDAGTLAGADIRTTLGGIDSTNSRYTAVHIHLGIDQIVVRTVICLARRICHRLKFAGSPDEVVGVPLIAVIEIDILPVCNRQASALGNIDLNTSQQSCILIDGHIAGLNIDSNVVGDRQYVACRVDIHACKRQRQRIQCRFAVYRKYKTVCLFIVILSKATGFHFEHTSVANEINSSSICGFHCINAAINLFVGAGIQRQGNFDVLYEVLRKWEHPMAHAGRCGAAAEVCNLIEFIHLSAGFRQNRAAAGDKAPCIEIAAVLDCNGAVIRHFNIAVIANGTSLLTTASSIISAAQADGTIDGNRSAIAHRQRSERLRSWGCANCRRSIRIQRSRLIKRNQQCNSNRNGIAAADRTIGRQGNLGLTVCLCIGNRFIQVCKPLTASLKKRQRLAHKLRRNGAVTFDIQGGGCRSRDAFACGQVIPAQELITIRRSRRHLIGGHGALRVAIFLGNEFSVYCISTVFSRHECRSCIDIAYQNHVGKGDLRGSTGAARLDVYFNALVCRQFLGKTGTRRNLCTIHLNGSAVLLNSVVKGKGCCCRLLICNCQCGFMGCIAACSARAGSCADNARTIGRPSIICVACKTQSNVLVG